MFEIIIATHGSLSDGLKDSAKVIIGAVDNVHTLNLNPGDDVNKLNEEIIKYIDGFGRETGVLILTDLANASPYNQALLAINQLENEYQKNKYVISGVNLPVLIQAISDQLSEIKVEEAISTIYREGVDALTIWSMNDLSDEFEEDDDF
ncbi:PTS sugar transporter subunit IIA [Helcococcus bovis]|uniref:PTS sugar transporter subunit IIA n=1 Tax=Helcococcus bovis TaxID=3153252 RepID=UPI0038B97C02